MKKIFMLFAACLLAFSLSAAELNIFASGLKAGAVNEEFKAEISYVLNAPATALEVQLLSGDEVKATIPVTGEDNLTKGAHTVTIDLSEVAGGVYTWAIKATGAATADAPVLVGTAGVAGDMTRGLTIDKNPESPFYGNIYTVNGKSQGLYAFDATLAPLFEGAQVANQGWKTGNSSPFNANVAADGKVFMNDWGDSEPNIRIFDPANPTAELKVVFGGTASGEDGIMINEAGDTIHGSMSWCLPVGAGKETVLYTSDEDYKQQGSMAIYKYAVGDAQAPITTKPEVVQLVGKFGIANGCYSVIPSKTGGWWVAQHRWDESPANPALIHIAGDTINYNSANGARVTSKELDYNSRGILAVNADQSLLVAGNCGKNYIVYDVVWTDGVPTLTQKYLIPHGLTGAYAVAIDNAGNVYGVGQNTALTVWALPKAENSCVTPAPVASTLEVKKAAVAKITYELNGGVANDYGWLSKSDMFDDFMHTANPDKEFQTLEYYMAQADPLGAPNICSNLLNPEVAFADADKWGWLKDYIVAVSDAQRVEDSGISAYPETGAGAAWRYAVGAFFVSGQRAGWPKSANFAKAGTYEAFQPAWGHAWANPVAPEAEFVLNAPYREGFTFDGWYANADFSGDKVLKVDASTEGTLYAKWIEYIPTVAEVIAMEDATKTKVAGTVSFVQGANFWIQDATGGILCYGKNNGLTEGDVVVLSGEKTIWKGSPELNNAKVESKEAGNELKPQTIPSLAPVMSAETSYLNQLVYVEGLKMARYEEAGDYKNPVVADALGNEIILYNMGVEETDVPVGAKVNIKAVVGIYNTTIQFRGKKEWVVASSLAAKDNYEYPVRDAADDFAGYTLTNEWIYSVIADNYSDNLPGPTDHVRGMAVKDGIMYFVNRANGSLTRVNGATGIMLDPLPIVGDHLFEYESYAGTDSAKWDASVTLPFNDLKIDDAGNALIGACLTSSQRFQIYKVDLETGAATTVIDERLWDNVDEGFDKISFRFDAFGVYGDVNNDAVIMAADANGWNAFRWVIEGGVAQPAQLVSLEPDENVNSYYIEMKPQDPTKEDSPKVATWTVTSPGTAPQIFPLEGGMFYVDGWATLPMLFDEEGYIIDDFKNVPSGTKIGNNEGDTCTLNTGHNGLAEFQIGDEYFLVMCATNTVGTPKSSFAIYKFKDAAKSFAEMEPLWYFPAAGMGELTNGCRTAVPSVEVDGTTAKIYVYTNNNGYAVYTMTGKAGQGDGVDNIKDLNNEVKKVVENGQVYIYKNGVKYTVLGVEVK